MNTITIVAGLLFFIVVIVLGLYFGTNTFGNNPDPIDGVWSDWGITGSCSEICGGGNITHTRVCTPPKHGGIDCQGSDTKQEPCNSQPCVIDGKFTEWEKDGQCTNNCGDGKQKYTRKCIQPQYGGKECDGPLTKEEDCNNGPCPINGVWSDWVMDGVCTGSECKSGIQKYNRKCTAPKHGGLDCQGSNSKEVICNDKPCLTMHRTADGKRCYYHLDSRFGYSTCNKNSSAQKLIYNPNNFTVSNFNKKELCLNKDNKLVKCNPNDKSQQWDYKDGKIYNRAKNYSIPLRNL
jgi:hypothetical protein